MSFKLLSNNQGLSNLKDALLNQQKESEQKLKSAYFSNNKGEDTNYQQEKFRKYNEQVNKALKSEVIKNPNYNKENWGEDLKFIAKMIEEKKFADTAHIHFSLSKRNLSFKDLVSIFNNGTAEIIQGHAIGTYFFKANKSQIENKDIRLVKGKYLLNTDEIRVIYGVTNNGTAIHVVVALHDESIIKIVTTYIPNLEVFEEDLKTLRKK